MKKSIKIGFRVQHKNVTPEIFFRYMPFIINKFNLIHDQEHPDVWFYRAGPKRPNCINVFYDTERAATHIDMTTRDWAFGLAYETDINSEKYMRQPNYIRLGGCVTLTKNKITQKEITEKKNFCAFVYTNKKPKFRNKLFKELSKYKFVHAPGNAFTNCKPIGGMSSALRDRRTPGMFARNINYFKNFKFVIACENFSIPGYTTEKLYNALLGNTIPIYWGNPKIGLEFNSDRFINCSKYKNWKTDEKGLIKYVVSRVIDLDNNYNKYIHMITRPYLPKNKHTPWTNPKRIIEQFERIFSEVKNK